ncbi:MAG: hypothetical protein MUD01_11665 [Chloroflexaceae bacterium]|jgi:CRISPR/Cas system-associated exonuclease Cas4 (RecB family)|nr:hypothetical protein [Chloroflexaceae bacterium]
MADHQDDIIRASEVGEYVYCARAWWLRRVLGWQPAGAERRAAGTAMHQRHGRMVRASGLLLGVAALVLLIGIILLVNSLR